MPAEPLSDRENDVYEYISRTIKLRGFSPSVRDIQSETGIKSTSTVQRVIEALESKGYIHREDGKSRTIRIDSYSPDSGRAFTVKVPVLKEICVGKPGLAPDNYEGYIDFPLMGRAYGLNMLFAYRIKDDSMKGCGILRGDTVIICKADSALDGDVVVEMSGGTVYIRKTGQESASGNTLILGRVISVIRFYRQF